MFRIFRATNNKKNLIFVAIMLALAAVNLLIILSLTDIIDNIASIGTVTATNIMMVAIAVIGGRVTPNFTRSYFKSNNINANIRSFPIIEKLAIILLILNVLLDLFIPNLLVNHIIVLFAAAVHLFRLANWGGYKALNSPIIWVLHLAYLWLVISLTLKALEYWLEIPYHLYLHSFTVGCVGGYILGIMTRATLGHTGRKLEIKPIITAAYIAISLAALIRIISPFFADYFIAGMVATIALWIIGFGMFLWVYAPILTSPRIDGKAG